MPPKSLIDPLAATNSGGVAGRRGHKFQDHIAASYLIDMLMSDEIWQVECETADDIVIRRDVDGVKINEYVQVKTTDSDSKWSISELTERDDKRPGTSIAEKSLACDQHSDEPWFRIVSSRDVRRDLELFTVPRAKRGAVDTAFEAVVAGWRKRHKTFLSKNGRNLGDWAERLLWQTEQGSENIARKNSIQLLQFANSYGVRPSHSEVNAIYRRLLDVVIDAGDAKQTTAPDDKTIDRPAAMAWWNSELTNLRASSRRNVAVYRVGTSDFFKELHHVDESPINRGLKAYDVEYDGGIWRLGELAEYLVQWVPEISLSPEVLAEFSHLEARAILVRAVEALEQQSQLDTTRLVADLMLHALLRHHHESDPIACKLFYLASGALESTSAHILLDPNGDQLWIGHARLATAATKADILSALLTALHAALNRDVLKAERNLILRLRHPEHLRPNTLAKALSPTGKIDDLLAVMHVPVLLAYDSEILAQGFDTEYEDKLRNEAISAYEDIKSRLGHELREVRVHIFLVPVECAATLVATVDQKLREGL